MITKKELLVAFIRYVKEEIIPHISDRSFRMILSAALYALDAKPDIAEPFFSNPVVTAILGGADGQYDVEVLFTVLTNVVNEYDGIPVVIPPVKFITQTETVLTFREGDVRRLKEYVDFSVKKEVSADA